MEHDILTQTNIKKLLFINFIVMSAFNMAHPVTPMLINELRLPSYMFGVLFCFMAIAQFIMSPIWGAFSDQRGRKRFLIIGAVGYGLSQIGFGYSTNIIVIFLFRLLGGALSVCYVTTAIAYMTDLSNIKTRAKYLAYHTATISLGSSVGSLLGGIIGQNDYHYTFLVQGMFCIIIAIIISVLIKEEVPSAQEKLYVYLDHLKLKGQLIDFKSTIGTMVVVMALITITTTSYNATINYYIESELHMPSTVNGIVMAIAGVIGLCMNLIVNPFLARRFDEYKSIKYTTLLTGISIMLASVFNNMGIALMLLAIFIASSSLVIPMQQSIISKLAKENHGEIMGIQGSAKALGMVVGSLSAGIIFMIESKLPFFFGGVCALIAFLILRKLNRGVSN